MSKWYGNIINRLEENKMYCDSIKEGTKATIYSWSDRTPYEVSRVIDSKHIFIKEMNHEHVGDDYMDNSWRIFSNPDAPENELKYRYGNWYRVYHMNNGTIHYSKVNISFGVAEYYYDYEF